MAQPPTDPRAALLARANLHIFRAYERSNRSPDMALADELYSIHLYLAQTIEWLEGTRRRRPELDTYCTYLSD